MDFEKNILIKPTSAQSLLRYSFVQFGFLLRLIVQVYKSADVLHIMVQNLKKQ